MESLYSNNKTIFYQIVEHICNIHYTHTLKHKIRNWFAMLSNTFRGEWRVVSNIILKLDCNNRVSDWARKFCAVIQYLYGGLTFHVQIESGLKMQLQISLNLKVFLFFPATFTLPQPLLSLFSLLVNSLSFSFISLSLLSFSLMQNTWLDHINNYSNNGYLLKIIE